MHLQTFVTKMPMYHHQGITEMVLYATWTGGERTLEVVLRNHGARNTG